MGDSLYRPLSTEEYARKLIRNALDEMVDKIGFRTGMDETTHGVIAPPTIETVASALVAMYNDPCPYNLSTLRQAIMALK